MGNPWRTWARCGAQPIRPQATLKRSPPSTWLSTKRIELGQASESLFHLSTVPLTTTDFLNNEPPLGTLGPIHQPPWEANRIIMKCSIDTARLRLALQALSSVASHRETLPILSGILVEAEGHTVRLTAHNLSLGLETTLEAEIQIPGKTVLPARLLADLARRLDDASVFLQVNDHGAEVTWQHGEAHLPTQVADEYPRPPFGDMTQAIAVAGPEFRRGIEHVAFAAGADPAQPVLEGVRIRFGTDFLEFLATDRSRVALSRRPVEQGPAVEGSVVFPAPALVTLSRLSGTVGSYDLSWDPHGITVGWDGTRLYSRLLDGAYPDVDRMIPEEYPIQAVVQKSALQGACARMGLLVDPATPQVYMRMDTEGVEMRSESQTTRAREQVPCRKIGPDLEISFNSYYLAEALDRVEGDDIVLELKGPEDLMRVRPLDRRDQYIVVLPMMMS